ncbi:MAG: dihydrofolate reductase, partial [Solirubrobacteraceae bacterium]
MELIIIVAISDNNVIGKDNSLLWHLPNDFKRFKSITSGFPIIMGRKTFESIGSKPLPKRENIVISSSLVKEEKNLFVVNSLEKAIEKASTLKKNKVF